MFLLRWRVFLVGRARQIPIASEGELPLPLKGEQVHCQNIKLPHKKAGCCDFRAIGKWNRPPITGIALRPTPKSSLPQHLDAVRLQRFALHFDLNAVIGYNTVALLCSVMVIVFSDEANPLVCL